ncbi:Tn3 family transposase [Deinococcus radiomollis]|uniref:Tn3 family transposase n=1 Tax=Deinococcus radiomollis TaxID=468916 RepID=UPI003892758B
MPRNKTASHEPNVPDFSQRTGFLRPLKLIPQGIDSPSNFFGWSLRSRQEGTQDRLGALGLVVKVMVLLETRSVQAVPEGINRRGISDTVEDVARLLPLLYEHIDMLRYGVAQNSVSSGERSGKARSCAFLSRTARMTTLARFLSRTAPSTRSLRSSGEAFPATY